MGLRTWLGIKRPQAAITTEFDAWFSDKDFSVDWVSAHLAIWGALFEPDRKAVTRILEVGSWEGRSAVFFLNFFPSSQITCIDTFAGTPAELDQKVLIEGARVCEARFDANTAAFGLRVRKIKGRSARELDRLIEENESFDLIYVDGDHARDAVLVDSLLAWQLLKPGGILIWDDYKWGPKKPEYMRPGPAIDQFVALYRGAISIIHSGYQFIVRRTAD